MIPISACGNQPLQREYAQTRDYTGACAALGRATHRSAASYNSSMRLCVAACAVFLLCNLSWAQEKSAPPKSVTVPAAIDHNRVVIQVDIALPDASTTRVL